MPLSGTQYATIDDFMNAGLPTGALSSLDKSTWNQALIRASSYADSFLGEQEPRPPQLTGIVCRIAAWRMACWASAKPDESTKAGFLSARDELVALQNGA